MFCRMFSGVTASVGEEDRFERVFAIGCRVVANDLVQGIRTFVLTNFFGCEMIESEKKYFLYCLVFSDNENAVGICIDGLDEVRTFGDWRSFVAIVFVIFLLGKKE